MSLSMTCDCAARMDWTSTACRSSIDEAPTRSARSRAIAAAVAGGKTRRVLPLCMIALSNRPALMGAVSSEPMQNAPADSPATVTFAGSPPNAAMLRRTQARPHARSCSPRLPDSAHCSPPIPAQ